MAPASAGLSVLMLAVTLNISAGITGTILPRRERYKTIPIIGLALATASALILAWRAKSMTIPEFEVLLLLIGTGFGCLPPLSSTTLQNNVSINTFGSAVATMQFSRNLCATILVSLFGAIVLAGSSAGAANQYSVEGFVHVFLAVAASFAAALVAVILLDEKPLETKHT
jgi:MFS family permease